MNERNRRILFVALTLATPFLLLLIIEVALRIFWSDGRLPLFQRAPIASAEYLISNPKVARRWFAREKSPPTPIPEPFHASKPARGFRVFVLGESSTAGFPYPSNATFSRLLRDVWSELLPHDTVEVVNLGIAATNSFAMLDIADEVAAQRPDAVIIYAGHNEWYGALGAGSTESIGSRPGVTRLVLALQRSSIVMAIRSLINAVRSRGEPATPLEAASLMEVLARDREIPFDSPNYRRGLTQFGDNLDRILAVFGERGIPVFVGSLASNVRDLPPLTSPVNEMASGADTVYAAAVAALARGDSAAASALFYRARDLDAVRFRAPTAFDSIVRATTARHGAAYVPVAEGFAEAAGNFAPGHELFLEHVHPNARGYALIARVFFETMRAAGIPRGIDTTRALDWNAYQQRRWLSAFDLAIAEHARNTIVLRWPFVPASEQRDYRATYRPIGFADSLAFAVSRGETWELAKLRLAEWYTTRGVLDSAVLEYRGLARDAPFFEAPHRLLARALLQTGRGGEAEEPLRRALAIQPTAATAQALAVIVLARREVAEGIRLLEQAQRLEPDKPEVLYQLAVARGMARDIAGARAATERLSRIAPNHPGLPSLMRALGGR